ncbi:Hypothetical predicted protein [Mytilus galloprovincialis]|uniref:Uncharacterized protein n=1 Tax=Mytilus galloprovincialis TaxID=29158 RepID=A0A8B6C9Y8_MYTGA|nr:Hypothetical predicted protein [Mytilus galloprovincialis]
MPDPEYIIHSKDPDYKRIEDMLPMAGSFQLPSVLSFVGYIVETKRPSLSSCCSCCSRIKIPRGFNTELEQLLFDKGKFDEGLRTIVFSEQDQVSQ